MELKLQGDFHNRLTIHYFDIITKDGKVEPEIEIHFDIEPRSSPDSVWLHPAEVMEIIHFLVNYIKKRRKFSNTPYVLDVLKSKYVKPNKERLKRLVNEVKDIITKWEIS